MLFFFPENLVEYLVSYLWTLKRKEGLLRNRYTIQSRDKMIQNIIPQKCSQREVDPMGSLFRTTFLVFYVKQTSLSPKGIKNLLIYITIYFLWLASFLLNFLVIFMAIFCNYSFEFDALLNFFRECTFVIHEPNMSFHQPFLTWTLVIPLEFSLSSHIPAPMLGFTTGDFLYVQTHGLWQCFQGASLIVSIRCFNNCTILLNISKILIEHESQFWLSLQERIYKLLSKGGMTLEELEQRQDFVIYILIIYVLVNFLFITHCVAHM